MIAIRPFEMKHAEVLCPKAVEHPYWRNDWHGWADTVIEAGPAYVAEMNGKPVMAGGLVPMGERRAWVWALFSDEILKHTKEMYRCVRDVLELMLDGHNIKELYALSNKTFDASQRLLSHLGFVKVGDYDGNHYKYLLKV